MVDKGSLLETTPPGLVAGQGAGASNPQGDKPQAGTHQAVALDPQGAAGEAQTFGQAAGPSLADVPGQAAKPVQGPASSQSAGIRRASAANPAGEPGHSTPTAGANAQQARLQSGALLLDLAAEQLEKSERRNEPRDERRDAEPGGRRVYQAVFVRAGRARRADGRESAIEMPAETLQQACTDGLFDQRAVFIDHAHPGQNPSLLDLAGVTRQARWQAPEVLGEIELLATPAGQAAAALLDELLAQGPDAPEVGLSLAFYPRWQEGGDGLRRVAEITHVESIDLVFQPAAGGRILAALSARSAAPAQEGCPYLAHPTRPDPAQPINHFTTRKEHSLMMDTPIPNTEYPTPEATTHCSALTDLSADLPAMLQADQWLQALAANGARALIAASGLPAASQARLAGQSYQAPEQVNQAIEAERRYLAALQADRVVQVGGQAPRGPLVNGMRSDLERLGLALEALIQGVRPPDGIQPLSGIREAYHLLSGDFEMSGLFQPERVAFANVTSSTMAGLVANALNKRLANEFQQYPQWWAPLVSMEDFTSLQDVRWITLGGVGELPTVAEGAAYTELSWDDKTETASFVKKGGYLGITLEAIDKDDVGRLRAAPRALAQAAWLTLSKALSNIFTANSGTGPAMSDGLALFHSSHANLGSTALSLASYQAARLAMRKQTELNSNERLGALTAPRYLLVPPDLEITALQVLASENDYTYALSNGTAAPVNPLAEGEGFNARMQSARGRVIVVDLWTDSNDWAAAADPRMYPTLGLGFRYGRAPEIFSVASPTAGLMFSNDTLPIKVRFFFAVGPVDWKGLYKANVA